ncbi:transglutaminase family protein [uncultured Lacinutrix sp.]|uniref:transglutaminase-like domain-containing protein n=1 Tax=uncultured Lacinutrix sp. TaxID=574032 RepID=UPI00263877E9|nr:transglutaminase-like domain-containing protein [uncultured Lacinutrix sp.]
MKSILTVLLTLCVLFSFAQRKTEATPEDISKAKKLKITYPKDDVIILNNFETISFNKNKKTEKITVSHENKEELLNISARADIQKYVSYTGESIVKEINLKYRNKKTTHDRFIDEAISDNDLFHHDARVKYANVSFPVQGYKLLFDSKKQYNDIKYFTSIYFNKEQPIINNEIKIIVPEWLNIEFKELNFEGYNIEKKVTSDKKIKSTIITYIIKDLKSKYDEEQSPGPSFIYPHLLVLAKSYKDSDKDISLFKQTKDLYGWYKSLVNKMEENPEALKEIVSTLTKDLSSDEEKIKNIYYWVQDNIRYIAFEDGIAGFKPDESQNVYRKKYGDCKGMANLTRQMLKLAGFDARLTWIGTKRIAYDYSTPNLSIDNHMICTLFKDGKAIFLDGTEKYNSFGEYAERIQGKQVLIEDGDNFILDNVPKSQSIANKETYTFNAKIEENTLKGNVEMSFDGESRASFLYYFNTIKNDRKEDAIMYYLNNDDKNLTVTDVETSDLSNRDNTLSIKYNLVQKNTVSSFGDEIYIDLDYKKEFDKFQFEERNTDYLFSYKKHINSIITLEIPANYKLSETPKNINIDTENYTVNVSFQQDGNILKYKKTFILKNAVIKTNDFENWNETMQNLNSIYNEQLILTKVK